MMPDTDNSQSWGKKLEMWRGACDLARRQHQHIGWAIVKHSPVVLRSLANIVHTWISHGLYEELRDVPPPIVLVLPRETNIELYKFLQNPRQRETLALTQQLQRLHVDDAGDGKQAEIGSDKHTFGGEVQTVQRDPHELENELRETRKEMDKVRAEVDMVRAEVDMVRAQRDAISKELTETADELSSRRARLEDLERAQAEHAQELKAVRENAAKDRRQALEDAKTLASKNMGELQRKHDEDRNTWKEAMEALEHKKQEFHGKVTALQMRLDDLEEAETRAKEADEQTEEEEDQQQQPTVRYLEEPESPNDPSDGESVDEPAHKKPRRELSDDREQLPNTPFARKMPPKSVLEDLESRAGIIEDTPRELYKAMCMWTNQGVTEERWTSLSNAVHDLSVQVGVLQRVHKLLKYERDYLKQHPCNKSGPMTWQQPADVLKNDLKNQCELDYRTLMNEHTRKLAPVKLLQQFALNRALAIAQLRELDRVMLHISSAYDTMLDHTNVGLILAEWIMGAYETEPAWLVKL